MTLCCIKLLGIVYRVDRVIVNGEGNIYIGNKMFFFFFSKVYKPILMCRKRYNEVIKLVVIIEQRKDTRYK